MASFTDPDDNEGLFDSDDEDVPAPPPDEEDAPSGRSESIARHSLFTYPDDGSA